MLPAAAEQSSILFEQKIRPSLIPKEANTEQTLLGLLRIKQEAAGNSITDVGAQALARALRRCRLLEVVSLSGT